jgi:CSLREA domain-containing protein
MKHRTKLLGKGFHVGARGLLAAALAVAALGLAMAPASAATIVVNTTTDQALGSCSGSCSLRDAVATANSGDNHVNACIHNGTLTAVQGQALIDAANAVRADIGC